MNLDGKYIEINRNNTAPIINYLYKNGYCWVGSSIHEPNYVSNLIIIYLRKNKPGLKIEFRKKVFYFNYNNPLSTIELDANILLREEKLKRILK